MTTAPPPTTFWTQARNPWVHVTCWAVIGLASMVLAGYLVSLRHRTVAQIASSWVIWVILAVLLLSLGLLLLPTYAVRRQRESGAASEMQRALAPLLSDIRNSRQIDELTQRVTEGIRKTLKTRRVSLLVYEPASGMVIDHEGRLDPLDAANNLLLLLSASHEPLPINGRILDWLRRASPESAVWLLEHDFHLLVPVLGVDGASLGLIALGPRTDDLPHLELDREALVALGDAVALTLEVWGRRPPSATRGSSAFGRPPSIQDSGVRDGLPAMPGSAHECVECGRLFATVRDHCEQCGGELEIALVPLVLPDKFRFERRLGIGGMGVVYLARDLSLHRDVAVKTLRRVSMEDAVHLRREARTAATVHHPNLALIHGVESWAGAPMLILEYLIGGTLDDHLQRQGPLDPRRALDLVLALASALERLHHASVLHRDLKPSNIGFTDDGTPKLMDFGIARLQMDLRPETTTPISLTVDELPNLPSWDDSNPTSSTPRLIGTLHYLSPEATNGLPPSPAMDLWGLNLVFYECLTGRRVFNGTILQVLDDIRGGNIPDVRESSPGVPASIAEYFKRALSADLEQRPATARALIEELESLRTGLT